MSDISGSTVLVHQGGWRKAPAFAVEVVEGSDAGRRGEAREGRLVIGTGEGCSLRLGDKTVSRFHAELVASEAGIVLRDLESTNGVVVGGVLVREVVLRREVEIHLGRTRLRLVLAGRHDDVPAAAVASFGRLIGGSIAMREIYDRLSRAAPTSVPVLLTGESGTGKELAARSLHEASDRANGPFEIVDCGGLPATLIEGELFGHAAGAFTGADRERAGIIERAHGGTLFLDELGELPIELQPKLLRALGEGEVRRLGDGKVRKVDVRVIAATNRDLRRAINAGRFRSDLYYRLAVVEVRMPALRERLEDLPALVGALLRRIEADRGLTLAPELSTPGGLEELVAALARHDWPGNVRELRNQLEQIVVLRTPPHLLARRVAPSASFDPDLLEVPFRQAKDQLVERFERAYLERLLDQTGGNVAEAARRAGVDRGTLFRSIRRLGLDRVS